MYISVDIDVLDPAYAPGTGTAEVGGWSTREVLSVVDGLVGLRVVGAVSAMNYSSLLSMRCDGEEERPRELSETRFLGGIAD